MSGRGDMFFTKATSGGVILPSAKKTGCCFTFAGYGAVCMSGQDRRRTMARGGGGRGDARDGPIR